MESGGKMKESRLRRYEPDDFTACMKVFDSNSPKFFAPEERGRFSDFLQDFTSISRSYFVLTLAESVVACGGLIVDDAGGKASLEWGMVHRDFHKQGLGQLLTQSRLELARTNPRIKEVTIDTSQHSRGFYERHGFIVTSVKTDEFGPGLDCWHMTLRL